MAYEGRKDINTRFDGTNFEIHGLPKPEDERIIALKEAVKANITKAELVKMIEEL